MLIADLGDGYEPKRGSPKDPQNTFSKLIPGYLEVLSSISRSKYDLDVVDLLLTSPCKLYELLKEQYGNEIVADFMMEMFIKPLISASSQSTVEDVLNYIKQCNDDIVKKIIDESLQRYIEEKH